MSKKIYLSSIGETFPKAPNNHGVKNVTEKTTKNVIITEIEKQRILKEIRNIARI